MSSSSPQHEPTMEEILASIRKIISEDASPEAAPPKQDNDVLELTQEVAEEPSPPPAPQAVPQPAVQPEQVSQPQSAPASQPDNDVVFVSHEETTVSHSTETPEHDGIFSDKARKAIDDAFAGLDDVDEAPAAQATRSAPVSVDGSSVEAVFERAVRSGIEPMLTQWMDGHREELMSAVKPLLREWMDEHFPALLEGAVREEVARVVKARGRR